MKLIKKSNILYQKLKFLSLHVFHYLENNGNTDFSKNGEQYFIDRLFAHLVEQDSKLVLFDVGANAGDYTQLLLEKGKSLKNEYEIHVFEPTQKSFQTLENRFQLSSQVVLNRKALSDSEGQVEIFYDDPSSTLASLHQRNLKAYGINMNQSELVEKTTLKKYVEEKQLEHISFLKLDVEGHEYKTLSGLGEYLNQDFIDFIQFEYGGTMLDAHSSLGELFLLLESAGFTVAKVMPKGLELRQYQPWMENFQYANYVAISGNYFQTLK